MLDALTYYIDRGNGRYDPFYEYKTSSVGKDEFYARQLCTYLILRGSQYELISNEMDGKEEILVLKEIGRNLSGDEEKSFRGEGIHIEFRSPNERENYRLLSRIPCDTHFDVLRYLLKDIVDIPQLGKRKVTSTEIDEDRGVYVLYVEEFEAW